MDIIYQHPDETAAAAAAVLRFAGDLKIWVFDGPMGAGKTTLIKAICQLFGVTDTVSSPTFSIVQEYQNGRGQIFFHFDFYRLEDETEAQEIGTEEYLYAGNYCFLEWAEKIPHLLPDQYLHIQITVEPDGARRLTLSHHAHH